MVEYHDQTHVSEGSYVSLGKVKIEEFTPDGNSLFRFQPESIEQLERGFNNEWKSEAWKGKLDPKQLEDNRKKQLRLLSVNSVNP